MAPLLSLTVLVDNNTIIDHYFSGEPGLSFLITTQDRKILFDTGYSDLFLQNATSLGENLLDLDMVVISHGHLDHTGGLPDLVHHLTRATIEEVPARRPKVIAHPYCFYPRPKLPIPNIGSIVAEDELSRHFSLELSTSPRWITDDLVFLGQIGRTFDFEYTAAGNRKILTGVSTFLQLNCVAIPGYGHMPTLDSLGWARMRSGWWALPDSNQRPRHYECPALTN